jgi:hypothetical protein
MPPSEDFAEEMSCYETEIYSDFLDLFDFQSEFKSVVELPKKSDGIFTYFDGRKTPPKNYLSPEIFEE